jgi:hypothetical protein
MDWIDRYKPDIRNVLVGLVIGALVWIVGSLVGVGSAPIVGLGVGVVGLAALELHGRWRQIRERIPFDLQSPIVRRYPKIVPPPPALGRLDFELYMVQASDALTRVLNDMSRELTKNSARVSKATARVQRAAGKPIQRRHRVVADSAQVIRKHARRLVRFEANYRSHAGAMVTNSRGLIENMSPGEDFAPVASSTAMLRTSTVESRASTAGYRDASQGTRSLNMSQALNGASEELIAVLDRVLEDADMFIAYCDWVAQQAVNRQSP